MSVTQLVPRPRSEQPPPGWESYGRCIVPRGDGLDLADLTAEAEDTAILGQYTVETRAGLVTRDLGDDLDAARAMCGSCPVLDRCRDRALGTDGIDGFAGGLTARERREWRARHRVEADSVRHAVLVPRIVTRRDSDGTVRDGMSWVLDLSTETRRTGQRQEITAEELVAVARLADQGWSREDIAARLVTIRAAGDGSETVPWTVDRVAHARAILAGTEGTPTRRPA